MLHKKHKIHFVGIGGIGMSGIAEVLLNSGYVVTGSDLQESEATRRLRSLGARVFVGHGEENLCRRSIGRRDFHRGQIFQSGSARSAAPPYSGDSARRDARRADAHEIRHRGGGSHGKTTTTSMIAAVLSAAGLDPTMVIGGRVRMFGTNAKMGQGEILVAEADESDGSFAAVADHRGGDEYRQGAHGFSSNDGPTP